MLSQKLRHSRAKTSSTNQVFQVEDASELCPFCGKIFAKRTNLNRHKFLCRLNSDNIKLPSIICAYCGKIFAHKSSLHRHETMCKNGLLRQKFKCPVCFAVLSRIDNYRRHYRACDPKFATSLKQLATCKFCHVDFKDSAELDTHECKSKTKPLLSSCPHDNCKMSFYRRSQLVRHLRKTHQNLIVEEKSLVFASMNEFLEWKFQEEQATYSCFTKRSGTRSNTDYYYCQLDGSSRPHCKAGEPGRKTSRRIKRGVTKQDRICLAKMTVKQESDGTCKVAYQPTHSHKLTANDSNHKTNLADIVSYLNEKIEAGSSVRIAFQNIINGKLRKSGQIEGAAKVEPVLVSRINTLALSRRVKMRNNADDAVSVMARVVMLCKEPDNPVVLYKPLGQEKIIGPASCSDSEELFVLGLQSKEQRVRMFESTVLCVSWMDETNAYGYRLVTLTVPDKHNRPYPVGFFLTNQFDQQTLATCFQSLLENATELNLSTVVLPDNGDLTAGLQQATSHKDGPVVLICLSNLYKIFKQSLIEMAPLELVDEMYQSLTDVIECADELYVPYLLERFVNTYQTSTPVFVQFLKDNYLTRIDQWTLAHRKFPHSATDTTILNESIHNRVKGEPSDALARRLDDLINILLDVEEDVYKNEYAEEIVGVPCGLGDVSLRHRASAEISEDCLSQLHPTLWEIVSETDGKVYEIAKCSETCESSTCYFVCDSPDCHALCSHLFCCSCEDKNPLCSHVHKLRTFLMKDTPVATKDEDDTAEFKLFETPGTDPEPPLPTLKIKVHLEQLACFVNQPSLARIENCLDEMIVKAEGQTSVPSDYAKLNQTVLKIGTEEVSLLHLKTLYSSDRLDGGEYCKRYMYPSIINSFLLHLQVSYNDFVPIHSDVALALHRKQGDEKMLLSRELLQANILLLPMNLFNRYWTCLAVFPKQNEMIYFNPLGKMTKRDEKTITGFLDLVADNVEWSITIPNSNEGIEDDRLANGVHVCHFAEEIAKQASLTPLKDVEGYRKHVYDCIVGRCLRRDGFDSLVCGKCKSYKSLLNQEEDAVDLSVCCCKCNQWYHDQCVGGLDIDDVCSNDFTCP